MKKTLVLILALILAVSVFAVSVSAQAPGYTGSRTTTSTSPHRCPKCGHVYTETTTHTMRFLNGELRGDEWATTGSCPYCPILETLLKYKFAEVSNAITVEVPKR